MRVTFEAKSGKTKLTLTYQETRQFLHSEAAVKTVREGIKSAIRLVDPTNAWRQDL